MDLRIPARKWRIENRVFNPLRFCEAYFGPLRQGYGNRPPIDDRNPIRKFSIDPLCLQNQGRKSKRKTDTEIQYRPRIVDTDVDCGPRFCGPRFRDSYPRAAPSLGARARASRKGVRAKWQAVLWSQICGSALGVGLDCFGRMSLVSCLLAIGSRVLVSLG